MNQGNTVPGAVQAQTRQHAQQFAAIEAIAGGRFAEAHRLILDLLAADAEAALVSGRCRYCGCSDDHACGIAVNDDGGAIVVRCSWYDDDRTVCSKLSCIARFEHEEGGEHVIAPASRIVVP